MNKGAGSLPEPEAAVPVYLTSVLVVAGRGLLPLNREELPDPLHGGVKVCGQECDRNRNTNHEGFHRNPPFRKQLQDGMRRTMNLT